MKAEPAYVYAAEVVRWVDGDTVDLRVDVGFHMEFEGRFRLYGIDTPERGQEDYVEARQHNEAMAPAGTKVVARTLKAADKYGRFLADLLVADGTKSVGESLVENKLAVPYFGGHKG